MFSMTEEISILRLRCNQKGLVALDAYCGYSSPSRPKLLGDLRRDGHELGRRAEVRARLETPMLVVGL